MADINDRLQRLSRRDELTRRVLQHRVVPPEVAGVGADFLDAVEAVANVVRRHPGMSIMVAPGDGRRGSAVVRITEQHGDAEVALVTAVGSGAGPSAPVRRDDPPPDRPRSGDEQAAPAAAVAPAPDGSGRPEQQEPAVWHPPRRWQPEPVEPGYGDGQPDGWRWSG